MTDFVILLDSDDSDFVQLQGGDDSDFEDDEVMKEEKAAMRSTLQDDLWTNRDQLTQDQFKALIGTYREHEDERKKLRDAEKVGFLNLFFLNLKFNIIYLQSITHGQ